MLAEELITDEIQNRENAFNGTSIHMIVKYYINMSIYQQPLCSNVKASYHARAKMANMIMK